MSNNTDSEYFLREAALEAARLLQWGEPTGEENAPATHFWALLESAGYNPDSLPPRSQLLRQPVAITYVVGFMFDWEFRRVALIRKTKPAWQKGKLNGIGGKVEPEETTHEAMAREFCEESGGETKPCDWRKFLVMDGREDGGWCVEFFTMRGDLRLLTSRSEEVVELEQVSDISSSRSDLIENLPWLIPLAIDHLADGRPKMVEAMYS